MKNGRILLVDASENGRLAVKKIIEKEYSAVLEAADGKTALEIFEKKENELDLLILDVALPEYDGWVVCREVRKKSSIPIIILTTRNNELDEIYGFEIGVDDYIKKPVNPTILLARIQVAINRQKKEEIQKKICVKNLEIDNECHTVCINHKEISLSPKEYKILLTLVENMGKIVTREELLRKVWGYYYYGGLRTVDTHMNRLRLKMGDCGNSIHTIHGFGYRFEEIEL